jgi:hypothetical protein
MQKLPIIRLESLDDGWSVIADMSVERVGFREIRHWRRAGILTRELGCAAMADIAHRTADAAKSGSDVVAVLDDWERESLP